MANGIGWYVSGEVGYQWLGTTDAFYGVAGAIVGGGVVPAAFAAGIPLPSYATWNAGIGFTYKAVTLDLRYSDTNLSALNCYAFTSDPGATVGAVGSSINPGAFGSNWCGATFIAKLSFDTTLAALK